MRPLTAMLLCLLLLGCAQQTEQVIEKPDSEDLQVSIIVGENYSMGEPISIQLKTLDYSVVYLNRSGGYSMKSYPSVWICREMGGDCRNIEYRWMRDFSKCSNGVVNVIVPHESVEKKVVWPAKTYDLLLLWNQNDWKLVDVPCGEGVANIRNPEQVEAGNYSVTFVYWVGGDDSPRSVSASFRIK
ncbi:MAG: hypothetical protein ABIG39_03275 [Candidatus Micrarchaeota archaeon]